MPKGTHHVLGTDEVAPPPRRDLVDDQLLEEIELLVDVITRVAGHAGYLSRDEVDSVLGLALPVAPSASRRTQWLHVADHTPTVRTFSSLKERLQPSAD